MLKTMGLFFLILTAASPIDAGQVNLMTYYPAPTAAYKKIYLQTKTENTPCGGNPDGTLFLWSQGNSQSLYVCQGGQPALLTKQCYNSFCSYLTSGTPCSATCYSGYLPVNGVSDTFVIDNAYSMNSIACCKGN